MSSAICSNSDQCKILSSGNGLTECFPKLYQASHYRIVDPWNLFSLTVDAALYNTLLTFNDPKDEVS